MMLAAAALAAAACTGSDGESGPEPGVPPGFEQDVIVAGLFAPTAFALLPDGRILIAEQRGVLRLVEDGTLRPEPFLDLSDHVNSYRERGLLGLAVDPDFATTGFVYLLYTYEDDPARPKAGKTGRFTRVTLTPDGVSRETVLLGSQVGSTCAVFPLGADCIPQEWMGHAVGDIAVADDQTLYLSIGDASNWHDPSEDSLRAQSLDSLAGKILRITPEGHGVPSNPFWTGNPEEARSKVWAYGLRNPFRFSISPWSGLPYVGDVGRERNEEIDVAARGANLGWPCYEGPERQLLYSSMAPCQALYAQGEESVRSPLVTWEHGEVRAAATGGVFATADGFPPELRGAYFYADYVRDMIAFIQVDAHDRLVTGPTWFATGMDGPVDLAFGPDGALYYLSIATGELRRIRYIGSPAASPPIFSRPSVVPAGSNPHAVDAADVNGDGMLDLVVALAGGDGVSVLLGAGDGTFALSGTYTTDKRPKAVAVADLDGDGYADLATANQKGESATVVLANGDGTFQRGRSYPTCQGAHDIVAADFDRDGTLDLAVACFGGTVVSVLRGKGDGVFAPAAEHESGAAPHSLVAGDFDGDGNQDLGVANRESDDVGVILGNADGSFAAAVQYEAGHWPHAIQSGDLNGDGRLDLVTANDGSNDVSVLLGRGDGSFAAAVAYPAGRVPKGLAVADLDGDGDEDVVTANTAGNYRDDTSHLGGDTVTVLLGDGAGKLGPPLAYVAGQTPFSVAAADLDGDGDVDLATTSWDLGTVGVLLSSVAH